MPLIIAATDFSEVAENAVNYACCLASAQKADILIIHSFMIPVMFSDIPMPVSLVADTQNDADTQMNKLVESMSHLYTGIIVQGKVIYGDTVNVIEDYAKENKHPWLIVVGNSSGGEHNTWPDSILVDAFKHLKYPVLAVPPEATFDPIKKICFAFDNKHTGNDAALKQLTGLAARFNAELHVLNVQPDVHNQDNNPDIDEAAKKILNPANAHYHIVYEGANIDAAIGNFIGKNEIDWLVMIPRKHSFFEGLFHKSHTKSIAHSSHIPVLALHDNG